MRILRPIIFVMLLLVTGVTYGQSKIYQKYATHSNLEVAYIDGFQLDEDVAINVTIIIAKNNFAWRWLLRDMSITPADLSVKDKIEEGVSVNKMIIRKEDRIQSPAKGNISENCFISVSYSDRTVVIYHLDSEEQYHSIVQYLLNQIDNEK